MIWLALAPLVVCLPRCLWQHILLHLEYILNTKDINLFSVIVNRGDMWTVEGIRNGLKDRRKRRCQGNRQISPGQETNFFKKNVSYCFLIKTKKKKKQIKTAKDNSNGDTYIKMLHKISERNMTKNNMICHYNNI